MSLLTIGGDFYTDEMMASQSESLAAMAKNSLQEADKNINAPWLDPSLEQNDSTMAAFRSQLLGETAGHEEMSANQQQTLSAVAAAAQAATPEDDDTNVRRDNFSVPSNNTAGEMMDTTMTEPEETVNNNPATSTATAGAKQEIHGLDNPPVAAAPAPTPPTPVKVVNNVQAPPKTPITPTAPVAAPPAVPAPQQSPSALAGPGPASSQSPVSGDDNAGESGTPRRGKRELANTKRAAQNRAAQRAFRARKEQHIKNLEQQVTEKTQLEEQNKILQIEINHLRTYVISLQGRLIEARGEDAVPPMPAELHNNLMGTSLPPAAAAAAVAAAGLQASQPQVGAPGGEKRAREEDGNADGHPSKKPHGTEEKKV